MKRATTVPLLREAFNFDLANVSLRFDPFAMTPFIGYHAGDNMQHWFDMGEKLGDKPPAKMAEWMAALEARLG